MCTYAALKTLPSRVLTTISNLESEREVTFHVSDIYPAFLAFLGAGEARDNLLTLLILTIHVKFASKSLSLSLPSLSPFLRLADLGL